MKASAINWDDIVSLASVAYRTLDDEVKEHCAAAVRHLVGTLPQPTVVKSQPPSSQAFDETGRLYSERVPHNYIPSCDVQSYVLHGEKIEAIKTMREEAKCSLVAAKYYVEALMAMRDYALHNQHHIQHGD